MLQVQEISTVAESGGGDGGDGGAAEQPLAETPDSKGPLHTTPESKAASDDSVRKRRPPPNSPSGLARRISDPEPTGSHLKLIFSRSSTAASSVGSLKDTLLWEIITKLHGRIPTDFRLEFKHDVVSYFQEVAVGDRVPISCACSGTVVWRFANEGLLQHWQDGFDVPDALEYDRRFCAEKNLKKANFLRQQHDVWPVFNDVEDLQHNIAQLVNLKQLDEETAADPGKAVVEWTVEFGSGCVCSNKPNSPAIEVSTRGLAETRLARPAKLTRAPKRTC